MKAKRGEKLQLSLSLFLFFPFTFGSQNCGQTFVLCLSKADRAQIKTQQRNLPSFSFNYVLNALVENASQHAACSELYRELNNHPKWIIPTQPLCYCDSLLFN